MSASKMTRRGHTRLFAESYDLTGRFYGPIIAQAKLIQKAIIKVTPKDDLDANIADFDPDLDKVVRDFWKSLQNLQRDIDFQPRSAIPVGYRLAHILVIHDAGFDMIASVCYLVSVNDKNEKHSNVLGSKCALRSATIPKNEKVSIRLF